MLPRGQAAAMRAEVAARDHQLMMREKRKRFRVIPRRDANTAGKMNCREPAPSLHDADQHLDDLAGVRGDAPGVGK